MEIASGQKDAPLVDTAGPTDCQRGLQGGKQAKRNGRHRPQNFNFGGKTAMDKPVGMVSTKAKSGAQSNPPGSRR